MARTVQVLDALLVVPCTVQLLDGPSAHSNRPSLGRLDQTVQILDAFFPARFDTVCSALSVPPSSYWTVPSVPCLSSTPSSYWTLGWHCPRLGRFIGRALHRPVIGRLASAWLTLSKTGHFLSAWPNSSKTWTLYWTVPIAPSVRGSWPRTWCLAGE